MDVLLGIVILIIAAVFVIGEFAERRKQWKQEDAEDEAFELSRIRRQEEFDRHSRAVARAMLMEQAAKIHFVGEVWHD